MKITHKEHDVSNETFKKIYAQPQPKSSPMVQTAAIKGKIYVWISKIFQREVVQLYSNMIKVFCNCLEQ